MGQWPDKFMNITGNDALQNWVAGLDRRAYAVLIGLAIGLIGGVIGLLMTLLEPEIVIGLALAGLAGLYILTNIQAALYSIVALMLLLPFGTFPFSIGFTPTLMDAAIGVFLLIYLLQWMTGRRRTLRLTPVHGLILVYVLWLILAFALGLRHSPITANIARQFLGTLLSIGLAFVIVDLLRDYQILRRLVLVVIVCIGAQTIITIGLYALPDDLANTILNTLGRIGYPVGNVINYVEANPALGERAIGTWTNPNSLGGTLAISGVLIAPQIFARKPVLRYRWLTFLVFALVAIALFLTNSRTSAIAMAGGIGIIALVRYRRFIPIMVLAGGLLFLLPQTQSYIQRLADGFAGRDLATQMRFGEYTDSLRLIGRYPIFGVGFTGTPDIDIYTDVASMYLIMANQIGLVGLGIFLVMIAGVFLYGLQAWYYAKHDIELDSIHLGYHAALLAALANATLDLYFFRINNQASITLFWLTITLALASSRLTLQRQATLDESTVAKPQEVM